MSKIDKKTMGRLKVVGYIMAVIALVSVGVAGTIEYERFIDNVKEQGAREFRVNKCDVYTDKDGSQSWLECDLD